MKRILLLFFILLLCGCKKEEVIQKEVELGSPISTLSLDYGLVNQDIVFQEDISDPKLNEIYHATCGSTKIEVKVVDTTPPVVNQTKEIILEDNEEYDLFDYVEINDLSKTSYQINDNELIVEDEAGNKQTIKLEITRLPKEVHLGLPYYNQYELNAPVGCEAVCAYIALEYQGYKGLDCSSFIQTIPISSNNDPHYGFCGSIYEKHRYDLLPAIYPEPYTAWLKDYGNVEDISNASLLEIKKELSKDHPVIIWCTYLFEDPIYQTFDWGTGIQNTHTVVLNGYDHNYIYYTDPVSRDNTKIEIDRFNEIYTLRKFAVVVCK